MRRDLVWAYVASGSKIASWAIVSAIVYRKAGKLEFGMLSMVRGTIGILNYTALGLAPAMVRLLAESRPGVGKPADDAIPRQQIIYSTGIVLAAITLCVGIVGTAIYAHFFSHLHQVPSQLILQVPQVVLWIGVGTMLRLFSDTGGAVLQTRGRIATDNRLLAASEIGWVVLMCAWMGASHFIHLPGALVGAAFCYGIAGAGLLGLRGAAAGSLDPPMKPLAARVNWNVMWRLVELGSLVLVAQLADYLYAPTDFILINHFLTPGEVAAYAPAVQMDAGLIALVTAISSVLLPAAALAHTAGSTHIVAKYYVRGTLASLALLATAAIGVWLLAPMILRIWLGADPGTTIILPLVLIHTVIGGSSTTGRAILLAMGKFKPFTASVLIAGAVNAFASYCFVKYLHWGLRGIVLGTIVAVVGRCALWMPWYVMRSLSREQRRAMPALRDAPPS
jgi:O-antigen/teichoic acid export membrane protein